MAFPHFAPHFKPGRRAPILDDGDRSVQASLIRQHKSDGKTNAVYFDAHAGPAKSKTLKANGFELLYGFQGTVNPRLSTDQVKEVWKLSTWE